MRSARRFDRPILALALSVTALCAGIAAAQTKPKAEPLRIAAAISLREALESIAADFERENAIKVEISLGSSGQLLAQIRLGAPLDAFVSAAHDQVDALEREGLVQPATRRVIACNDLVLITPKRSDAKLAAFQDLAGPLVQRVAMGDPETVPAGRYAQQTLEKLKLFEPLKPRLVYGTNVRQVLDYVVREEVTAGIVYATDARAEAGHVTIVATADPAWHSPIEYPAVVLKSSRQSAVADKFITGLTQPRSAAVFKRLGFSPPPASQPASGPAKTGKP